MEIVYGKKNDFTILFESLEEAKKDQKLADQVAIGKIELSNSIREIQQIVDSFSTPYEVSTFTKS